MPALPTHRLGVALDMRRVIQDQVTGYQGRRRTTWFLRPLQALTFVGSRNQWLNFSTENSVANFCQASRRPPWADQETAQIPDGHQGNDCPQHPETMPNRFGTPAACPGRSTLSKRWLKACRARSSNWAAFNLGDGVLGAARPGFCSS